MLAVGMTPLVSIVVPSFNQGRFLEEALRSVIGQDYPRVELLVADGGSTDDSVAVLRRNVDRIAWWYSEPDGGQAAALNRAFARASGEILGWINADDTLLPDAVSAGAAALEARPDALLVYGDAIYIDEEGREMGRFRAGEMDVPEMMRRCQDHVVQPGSLFRRRALELAGPFEGYFCLDFEFVARIGMAAPVVRLDRPLATYRLHGDSKSMSRPELAGADFISMYDRFFARPDVTPEVRAVEMEARSQAYLIAGELLYAGLKMREARSAYLRALRTDIRRLRPRTLTLFAKTFLPRPLVRRLRRARATLVS